MKKLHYLLTAGGLMLAAGTHAQVGVWSQDTVLLSAAAGTSGTAAAFNTDVFYHFGKGETKRQPNNDWHIAFGMGASDGYSVIANHGSAGVTVYSLNLSAAAKFGTDLIADTVGKKSVKLYNSIEHWAQGAFNQNANPSLYMGNHFGWGAYDFLANPGTGEHNIKGDSIFLVTTSTGHYQVWIERFRTAGPADKQGWEFHIADIDGSNRKDDTIYLSGYTDKLFAYYNLGSKEELDREPVNEDWDIVFTKYMDEAMPGMLYPYTAILNNHKLFVAELRDIDADTAEYHDYALDSVINSIGRDWKTSNMNDGKYVLDTVTYFVKSRDNNIYQLEITYSTTAAGPAGVPEEGAKIGFRKRLSVEATEEPEPGNSVAGINAAVESFNVFPNPAQSKVNILIDVKERTENARISIMDLSGRTVLSSVQTLNAGLNALGADVNNYPAGVYLVTVNGNGWTAQEKIVVQH